MEEQALPEWKNRTPEEIKKIKDEARAISKNFENQEIKEDKVNHPSHYTWLKKLCGIEVIDITRHMCFNLGNVVKYILRAGHKSEEGYSDEEKELEDLKKAKWYLEDEISMRSKTKVTDIDIIRLHEKKIDELEKQIATLSEANWHLRQFGNIGEMKLSMSEVFKAAEVLRNELDNYPIVSIRQTTAGIGITTELVCRKTENDKDPSIINITDYDTW